MDFFMNEKLVISVDAGPECICGCGEGGVCRRDPRLGSSAKLLHRLIDGMVDRYLPVLDTIEDRIEMVEAKAIEHTSTKLLSEIFELKRALIEFRRVTIGCATW